MGRPSVADMAGRDARPTWSGPLDRAAQARSLIDMADPTSETITLSDGYHAAARWWRPDDPTGAVLYLHGIQSHGGWYERSAGLLAERGLAVLMPDRRGSGRNTEQRGHLSSATQVVEDANDALGSLLAETGLETAHVVGVSWGGKPAVALAEVAGPRVASLSLVAPGLFPRVDLTAAQKVRVAMAMLHNRDRMFDIPLNDPRAFTANPARIRFVKDDPLKLTQVTAGFLLASRRLDRTTRRFSKSPWRGPIHLLLAGRDRIIDNEPTRQWLRGLPSPIRQITEYPEAEHTLEFEVDPAGFFQDLVDWIAERSCQLSAISRQPEQNKPQDPLAES